VTGATRNTPPNDWLRQGSAALILSLAVIGGGGVYSPTNAHTNIGPSPTKGVMAAFAHKIVVKQIAVEPETIPFRNFGPLAFFENQKARKFFADTRVANDDIRGEWIRKLVTRLIGQLISKCPSIENFFWESLCFCGVPNNHSMNITRFRVSRFLMSQQIWFDSNNRQLERDSCTDVAISGVPHFLARFPQSPSERGDGDGSERGNDALDRVKAFSDLNQNEWGKVIGGALFVAGLGFLAYLARRA